ncbi:MAG: hypothetical protein HKL80_01850 [Acidimicrobiales bacterium]|nr:hypothetical protein [Acidimicrobiales bacterium]
MRDLMEVKGVTKIRFFADPICPWTWVSATYVIGAAKALGLEIEILPMSLKILNENNDLKREIKVKFDSIEPILQSMAYAAKTGRSDLSKKLYFETGYRLHSLKVDDIDMAVKEVHEKFPQIFGEVEENANLANDYLTQLHSEAMALVGPEVGSPVLHLFPDGGAIHGPIISKVLDDPAGELLKSLITMSGFKEFSEIKRQRFEELDTYVQVMPVI